MDKEALHPQRQKAWIMHEMQPRHATVFPITGNAKLGDPVMAASHRIRITDFNSIMGFNVSAMHPH